MSDISRAVVNPQVIDDIVYKTPVRAASIGNEDLADLVDGYSLDGVVLNEGDRILLKNQTAPEENGLYIIQATDPAIRTSDANGNSEVKAGMLVVVTEGTVNADKLFLLTTDDPIVLDTDPLAFVLYGSGGSTDKLSQDDQDLVALTTVSDFDPALASGITNTPLGDGNVGVYVNGLRVSLGNGVKTKACYFSGDGGATARTISNITAGDILYWVGSVAGYQLTTAFRISFEYVV